MTNVYDQDPVRLSLEGAGELEVLLRKISTASVEDLATLHAAGLNEAVHVYAEMLEDALEDARDE